MATQGTLHLPPLTLYRPVDAGTKEIRVLALDAGSGDELLKCKLRHVQLSDPTTNGSYETISYAWGDPGNRGNVCIDEQLVAVPASSKSALQRMRHPALERTLWIDAVCINQSDAVERSNQVALMSEIYSSSAGNLVWLGEADDTTESALTSIHLLLDEVRSKANDGASRNELLYDGSGALHWAWQSISTEIDLDACSRFYSNVWFTRRWVVQEIALAPRNRCHCGPFERPLEEVLTAAAYIGTNLLTLVEVLRRGKGVANAEKLYTFSGGRYDAHLANAERRELQISTLLLDLREFDNDDPRDCVYALLALYQKYNPDLTPLPELLRPDYTLSLANVLCKATTFALSQSSSLELLNETQHRVDDVLENDPIPSWVPRFDRHHDWDRDYARLLTRFHADDGVQGQFSPRDAALGAWSTRLWVRAYLLGTVTEYTVVMTDRIFQEKQYTLERIADIDAILGKARLAAPRNEVVGITLCAGGDYQNNLVNPIDAAAAFAGYESVLQPSAITPRQEGLEKSALALERRRSRYEEEVNHSCPRRRFFRTSDETCVGLGPQCLQHGDVLGILIGCPWPVILRKVSGEVSNYRYIGTAYVYGIMFGEAFRRLQAEGRFAVEIALI